MTGRSEKEDRLQKRLYSIREAGEYLGRTALGTSAKWFGAENSKP